MRDVPTTRVIKVLDVDPELAGELRGERLQLAARQLRAPTVRVPAGPLTGEEWSAPKRLALGLLVLEGLLVRRVVVEGRSGAELLGPGDLLRPWQGEDDPSSVVSGTTWRVLRAARLALLEEGFAERMQPFPEVQEQLVARALLRARGLAVNLAIVQRPRVEARVLLLLWHLAGRWGRVRPEGVILPLRLSHADLADLVAARRPTVTLALRGLARDGALSPAEEGWLLHGKGPGAAAALAESDGALAEDGSPLDGDGDGDGPSGSLDGHGAAH